MKKVIINLSNKTFYTLVVIGVLVLLGIGVYALSPGETPNPGHNIQDIGPPLDCESGEVLQYDGDTETWACTSAGGVDTRCDEEGNCDNVCIGQECQSSWPSAGGCPTGYDFLIIGEQAICSKVADFSEINCISGTQPNNPVTRAYARRIGGVLEINVYAWDQSPYHRPVISSGWLAQNTVTIDTGDGNYVICSHTATWDPTLPGIRGSTICKEGWGADWLPYGEPCAQAVTTYN